MVYTIDHGSVNIVRNTVYHYDGIIDNLDDAIELFNLTCISLSILSKITTNVINTLSSISNPSNNDTMIQAARIETASLIAEYQNVIANARYNSLDCLVRDDTDYESKCTEFQYSLPGKGKDHAVKRDNMKFQPSIVGSTSLPASGFTVYDMQDNGDGSETQIEVKAADGTTVVYLADVAVAMEDAEVANDTIRGRCEQYIALAQEVGKAINIELIMKKTNVNILEIRKEHVEAMKDATLNDLQSKKRDRKY